MSKKPKYVQISSVAAFGIPLRDRKTLIATEPPLKGGRAAAPGGKMEECDNGNPDITRDREIDQEVGTDLEYRQVAQPYVFCTRVDADHNKVMPVRGHAVDLRFFSLLEVIRGEPQELEPDEFQRPRFVEASSFDGLVKGVHIRTAFFHARKYFQGQGLWPVIPAGAPTVLTNFADIRQWMDENGFDPDDIDYLTNRHAQVKPPRPWLERKPQLMVA